MRKGLAVALVAFFVFLAGSAIVAPMRATDSEVGVKVGDVIDYAFDYPGQILLVSQSAHLRIERIDGTLVTYSCEVHYSSGLSIGVGGAECNISASDYNVWMQFLVLPHLKVGDPTYIGSNCHVNDTSMMFVAYVNRMVNHVIYPMDPVDGGGYADLYYDVESGLLVRYYYSSEVFYGSMVLTFTSVFPCGIMLVVAIGIVVDLIALTAIAYVGLRRRSAHAHAHRGSRIRESHNTAGRV